MPIVPERIAEIVLKKKTPNLFYIFLKLSIFYFTRIKFICANDYSTNLNRPSGSNGARHQAGASLRRGPEFGELRVQAYKFIRRSIAKLNQ